MFDISTAAVVFGVVFLAELPDKTALAGLVLGTRFRASYVFAGIAAAFALHVALAVAAGSVLTLLPQRPLQAVVGVLFLGGAVLLLREAAKNGEDEEAAEAARTPSSATFWRVAGSGFMLILVAEFGDLTQIMTANLAARYDDPLSVAVGAVLALWAVAGIGVLGGAALMKRVPLRVITRVAAVVMVALAAFSFYEAITG
ncbi:Putative Ca2+/H+ antiporter, TMEM165/GDT1 family [Streptomyces zhaozhouensis]|uniref:GDT1 family protein n=1 Tax=Streptomyces zhaozhouensis TaxID=1300267 RepID=A0A286DNB8_9ACTN|nr:TMEM165/GDT1 family protein [Streptomyces zhaozhouensis]SOD60197.1 Putative Ca2+/H+ antiporter, TMEM165/GDT1 family [Streptomyces zhaozhouensis]